MSINATSEQGEDRLSVLPPEILHLIFDYLFPTHDPLFYPSSPILPPLPSDNPVWILSITSKTLKSTAQSWALHFLRRHASITGYKALADRKKQDERDFLLGNRGVFPWIRKHCVFCGKHSSCYAILMNGFRCCRPCDREQWPDKITRSEAKATFGLKDRHLRKADSKEEGSSCWPSLRFGQYVAYGTLTTMYLRADVKALAEKVHGDLQVFQEKRDRAKVERSKKQVGSVAKAPLRERKRRRRAQR